MMPVAKSRTQREQHRQEAEARQEERNARHPREQLRFLDERLGKDQGAKRERARLEGQIEKEKFNKKKKENKKNDS